MPAATTATPKQKKRSSLKTPEATAMFVYVWEPREPMNEGGKAQFSISLLFKKSQDISELKRAVVAARKAKFGDQTRNLKDPFRDVEEMENPPPGYKGGVYITAKSTSKPGIVDKDLEYITEPMDFYAGCKCRATVTPFAFDKKGSKGVTFLLNNIQKLGEGDRLDGRKKADEDFDAVGDDDIDDRDDDEEDDDPLK